MYIILRKLLQTFAFCTKGFMNQVGILGLKRESSAPFGHIRCITRVNMVDYERKPFTDIGIELVRKRKCYRHTIEDFFFKTHSLGCFS